MDDLRLLTLGDVARLFRVSLSTLRRIIARGELPTVRVGTGVRVRHEDAAAYLAREAGGGKG